MKLLKNLLDIKFDWKHQREGSDFIFDCVHLLYYKYHKINFKQSESYIDSLDWIKNKKATINPIKMIMFPICCKHCIKPSRILKKRIKNNKN